MIEQKSKAPLNLMEQVVMILVFAFAAALCVQAFVVADSMSKEAYARDKAALICQTVAETVKSQRGNMEMSAKLLGGEETEQRISLYYDENWEGCNLEEAEYIAVFTMKEADSYLGQGEVAVKTIHTGETIFDLLVSWQKVN